MFRTWKSKNTILDAVKDTICKYPETFFKDSTKALFPLMMIVNSEIIANSLCEKNYYIEMIDNNTNRNFLTCDLPVINLAADYNGKTDTSELIIYYPLTPRLAIICKNSINSNNIISITNNEIVDEYNRKIISAATRQVYAKNKEDLEIYFS